MELIKEIQANVSKDVIKNIILKYLIDENHYDCDIVVTAYCGMRGNYNWFVMKQYTEYLLNGICKTKIRKIKKKGHGYSAKQIMYNKY